MSATTTFPDAIRVSADKVTTVQQWRRMCGLSWETSARRHARDIEPVFVLRANGSGTLFFCDGAKVRRRSWRRVIVAPTATYPTAYQSSVR